FRDALYVTSSGASDPTEVYGGGNPMQTGYGSTLGSIDVMHVRGAFMPTDYPTDCMINGQGFFLVGPDLGPLPVFGVNSLNLTRVGSFVFDGSGNFVDMNRNLVYGFIATAVEEDILDPIDGVTVIGTKTVYTYNKDEVEPLRMPLDEHGELMILKQISIGADGTIIGIDDNNNVVQVGKIAVANVPNPSALEASSNSYYTAKANTGDILASIPGENTTGAIQAGGLEMSNVDLAKEFTDMITTQRGYQANTRIITVTDEMLAELVNMKR
ncbi:MAG: flagellar hook-basal body complex protein, partial [Oscillospiraceae bacterium]|nr:flagellar hook-basal body complex protein [Oscillospiraceae bacterium]